MTEEQAAPENLHDDELAILEREAEQTMVALGAASDAGEHARLYSFIDGLASPIRIAIMGSDLPPVLPDYTDLEEIGRGGMGVVYSGRHKDTQRTDAIKVIRPDRLVAGPPEHRVHLRNRFERESQLAARIAHEHIVPVYQVGESDGCPWYSMQLVNGQSLHELCEGNVLPFERTAMYVERIARALDTVHRHGILHGDIKPHNILIERDSDRPMLTDFGLGDVIVRDASSAPEPIAGTLNYMAPEVAHAALNEPDGDISAQRTVASDIYSLGVTLWFALTGQSPVSHSRTLKEALEEVATGRIQSDPMSALKVPIELTRICIKCQAINPEDRFNSVGELADALQTWRNRPAWNQYFPRLRVLLWSVLAPLLALSGVLVWWLIRVGAAEPWIWVAALGGYAPLFYTIFASQHPGREADRARRELWSNWIGHAVGSIACLGALRIVCHPNDEQTFKLFYPAWAAICAVTFYSKSGNFWSSYRWIGIAWAIAALVLAMTPAVSPVLFGFCAALTCVVIARGDMSFDESEMRDEGP